MSSSPFRFDALDEDTAVVNNSSSSKRTRRTVAEEVIVDDLPLFDSVGSLPFDTDEHLNALADMEEPATTEAATTAASLPIATSSFLSPPDLMGLASFPAPNDDFEVGHDGCLDEVDDEFLNIWTILDPVHSVARKSIHKTSDEDEDEDDPTLNAAFFGNYVAKQRAATNRKSVSGVGDTEDLLSSLTEDLVFRITAYLDASDLVHRLGMINRQYRELSQVNQVGWEALCQRLVETKCHVTLMATTAAFGPEPFSMAPAAAYMSKRTAYRLALADSHRQHITVDELCYNPETNTGTIWSFRFKESAGTDWTTHDPWYAGQPCRKMVFLSDFTMKLVTMRQASSPATTSSDSTSATDAAAAANATSTTADDVTMTIEDATLDDDDAVELVDPPSRMSWRFLTRPMDLPTGPLGSYVRIQVAGRDVPTYAVRRSPTGNWGFVLESCWGVYGSFELPPRLHGTTAAATAPTAVAAAAPTAGVSMAANPGLQAANAAAAAVLAQIALDNDPHQRAGHPHVGGPMVRTRLRTAASVATAAREAEALMQDDTMRVTNERQWREAFLYNVGARMLPEGDEAIDEFDRFWQNPP